MGGRTSRFLYETGSITEHTQIWWSVRPHLAFPTVEIRICDAQPDLGEARSLAALGYSLTARIARALDEGEPLPDLPHRLLEENLWRAIRYGLSGELIDFERGESMPARARLEQLSSGCAGRRGARRGAVARDPGANAAERQIARYEEGASLEEIFAEQVPPVSDRLRTSRARAMTRQMQASSCRPDRLRRARRSRRSPTASSSRRRAREAHLAIDALDALLPLLEGRASSDFSQVSRPAARVRDT